MPSDQAKINRLTQESRDEITRRVLAGEKQRLLAEEFGVTNAYISLLKATALNPDRYKRKAEAGFTLKLTDKEIAQLKQIFNNSTPESNGLIPARTWWTLDQGFQLARKVLNKKPSQRMMKECMKECLKEGITLRPIYGDPKPKPPQVPRVKDIDPELAQDPTYVTYIRSAVYRKIAQREYEMALADWERRNPTGEETSVKQESKAHEAPPADIQEAPPAAPRQRRGKHAQSKGSPFTPPKARRKKRR